MDHTPNLKHTFESNGEKPNITRKSMDDTPNLKNTFENNGEKANITGESIDGSPNLRNTCENYGETPETIRESMDGTSNLKNICENNGKMVSLETMCFDLIVQKFERFYFAFTNSNNVNFQRKFELLQRTFSYQLLTALYENKNLKEEYFELLINEHLHFLKGEWLENSRCINSTEDIFRRLPNLTRVAIRHCDDKILENIAKFCSNIVEIDVRDSNVTDVGVVYLCEKDGIVPCPKLKILLIEDSDVTDVGAEYVIRKLPLLEKFDYINVHLLLHSIYQESLSKHQKAHSYNLTELNLLEGEYIRFEGENMYLCDDENMYQAENENMHENFSYCNEVLKTCLTVCPKLETIGCFITDKEQLNLLSNRHFKKLFLGAWKTKSKLNFDNFLKMSGRNLTFLKIYKGIISISALAENCPVLEKFKVGDVNFTEEDNDDRVIFPCLIKCRLTDIRPSDAKGFCLLLSFSPKLETLKLVSSILSLEMKNQILMWCLNSVAQEIKFVHIFLEMKFVRDILLSCRSLKVINFICCKFDALEAETYLESLAERLPNKPRYHYCHPCPLGLPISPDEDGHYYLRMHPEEKYESSSFYDSLLSDIERNCNDYDSDKKVLD